MAQADAPLSQFLEQLGEKTPAPGGGAVAGVCGALASALARMVVAYSQGKKSLAQHEAEHARAIASLESLRAEMLELAHRDEQAYAHLNALQRLPEGDPGRAEIPDAIRAAIDVPCTVVDRALKLLELLRDLTDKSNKYLLSDLAIAAVLAEATASAGAWNVRVNEPLAADAGIEHEGIARARISLGESKRLRAVIEAACAAQA